MLVCVLSPMQMKAYAHMLFCLIAMIPATAVPVNADIIARTETWSILHRHQA